MNIVASVINLSSLDRNNGFRLDGAAKYDLAGWSFSNAGAGSNYVVFGYRDVSEKVIQGTPSNDYIRVSDLNFQSVDGGYWQGYPCFGWQRLESRSGQCRQ